MPSVLALATAGGINLGTASDIVTDALTAFGLKASDTSHFVDVLATASSKSNTNVTQMGEAFKMSASIAGAFNYSIDDTALALGLMANAGIKAGTAGRSLRQAFSTMTSDLKLTTKSTDEYVVATTNSDGTMRALRPVLVDMRKAFADMTDSQKASNAEAIAGKTGMSGLLAIMNATDEEFYSLANAIDNCNGSAEEMSGIMARVVGHFYGNIVD